MIVPATRQSISRMALAVAASAMVSQTAFADGPYSAYQNGGHARQSAEDPENIAEGIVNADGANEDARNPMSTTARAFRNGLINGRAMQKAEDEKRYAAIDLPPLPAGMASTPPKPHRAPRVVAEDDDAKWTTIPPQTDAPAHVTANPYEPEAQPPQVVEPARVPRADQDPGNVPSGYPAYSTTTATRHTYTSTTTSSYSSSPYPYADQAARPSYTPPLEQERQQPVVTVVPYVPPQSLPTQYVYLLQPGRAPLTYLPMGYWPRRYAPHYAMVPRR